jgi:hypothetical protein
VRLKGWAGRVYFFPEYARDRLLLVACILCLTNSKKRLAFAKSDVAPFLIVVELWFTNIQALYYALLA